MLDGFDKNWTDASSRRVAYYTNLPPGSYQFRVAAFEMNDPRQISEDRCRNCSKATFLPDSLVPGLLPDITRG